MTMSNEEIKRSYQEAKNKKTQIGILADLNTCSKDEIIDIVSGKQENKKTIAPQKNKKTAAAKTKKARQKDILALLTEKQKVAEEKYEAAESKIKELSEQLKEETEKMLSAQSDYKFISEVITLVGEIMGD